MLGFFFVSKFVNFTILFFFCLPQHNELSILHWHFGGGGGGDVFLLWRVHWEGLIQAYSRGGEMDEIQTGQREAGWERRGRGGGRC